MSKWSKESRQRPKKSSGHKFSTIISCQARNPKYYYIYFQSYSLEPLYRRSLINVYCQFRPKKSIYSAYECHLNLSDVVIMLRVQDAIDLNSASPQTQI